MQEKTRLALATALCTVGLATASIHAQTIDPFYAGTYSYTDLGSVSTVPGSYGGITFLDNGTLLIGGAANGANGAIYSVPVTRDAVSNQVTGFGAATLYASSPQIDGGLDIHDASGVIFYTGYPTNQIGQIKPGSTAPDKVSGSGVASSVGSLVFVPQGFAGAGRLKLLSYNASTWNDATITPDGTGTFNITNVGAAITLGGGLEGAVYIADDQPVFDADSVLVNEFGNGSVVSYEIDANGDPIPSTRRIFMSGLSGAEGATIDPVTGDFLFATFGGGNRVIRVQGFLVPEPATLAAIALPALLLRRRR